MVEVGAIIAARVREIAPYGIWLDHDGQKVLVMIPDVSWRPIRHPSEAVEAGQVISVKVQRYNYRDRVIVGSLKALDPEGNPYRQLSRLEPGTVLQGEVASLAGDVITVRLPNHVWGEIPKYRIAKQPQPGDKLGVTIASIDIDEGRLYLDPALDQEQASRQHDANLVPT